MPASRAAYAPVSFEVAHITRSDLHGGSGSSEQQMHAAAERYAQQAHTVGTMLRRHEGETSTVVLVDDYFSERDAVREPLLAVLDACRAANVSVDHVVYESECAFVAQRLLDLIVDDPLPGDGTSSGLGGSSVVALREQSWLSSFGRRRMVGLEAPRVSANKTGGLLDIVNNAPAPIAPGEQLTPRRAAGSTLGYHEINLEVELYDDGDAGAQGDRKWACPLLAACWQLLRLGALMDEDGNSLVPPLAELEHPALSENRAPFNARATLSVLSPRFLDVEHSVRLILGRLDLAQDAVRHLTRTGEDAHKRPAELLLDRIGYVFAVPGFPPLVAS